MALYSAVWRRLIFSTLHFEYGFYMTECEKKCENGGFGEPDKFYNDSMPETIYFNFNQFEYTIGG